MLAVTPSLITLPANQWTTQFTVKNVGGSDMAWFAVGVPNVISLSALSGNLAPGQHVVVSVLVDHTQIAKGPFSHTFHVSANDTAKSVTVKGEKKITPALPPGPGGLVVKP